MSKMIAQKVLIFFFSILKLAEKSISFHKTQHNININGGGGIRSLSDFVHLPTDKEMMSLSF